MKLIVDISEAGYEALKNTIAIIATPRSGKTLMREIYNAVANGKPYREADDYENEIADLQNRLDIAEYDKERYKEEITTLEAENKGEWIKDSLDMVVCSNCGEWRRDNRIKHINFCNCCGADMRGGE